MKKLTLIAIAAAVMMLSSLASAQTGLGYSLLQVDASADSCPILLRLGLRVVGGTVPYVTTPTATGSAPAAARGAG